jgi:CRP-like cAMP-binding protein
MLVFHHFSQNDIIYQEGAPVNEIFFLLSGLVGMVLKPDSPKPYIYINQGNYFGEIEMINQTSYDTENQVGKSSGDKRRKFTTKAFENVDLLTWSKKNIYLAENEFEYVIDSLFGQANKRLK